MAKTIRNISDRNDIRAWLAAAAILLVFCVTRVHADVTHTIEVDGRDRHYTVHEPAKAGQDSPLPVVLVFHGGGSNAGVMARYAKMNDKADDAGFLVVYPSGTGRAKRILTWNGGDCCGYAARQKVDDVKFVDQMLDDLAKRYRIDKRRVYATGISNGAMISYKLAAELADRIAAWVKLNRCVAAPKVEMLPNKDKEDGCTVRRETYRPRRGGAPVVLYVIKGGGHTWPGHEPSHLAGRRLDLGPSTHDIDANDEMWAFFEKFALE